MSMQYNFIYSKLVSSEDDLVGLIAYGIYKKHKIEFISKIKDETGREPNEEECRSFFAASNTSSQLRNYRSQAEDMLSEVMGNIAREEISSFEEEMLRNYRQEISSCIPSDKKTFWLSLLAGVVSAFCFSLIAAAFYFMGETSERSTKENTQQLMEQARPALNDSTFTD